MRKMARDEKTKIEAKASQQGRDRLKQVQKEIREEVTKLRKELREQYRKKVENLTRRSKDCKYHKLCKVEHEYEEEIRKILKEKVNQGGWERSTHRRGGRRRERVTHIERNYIIIKSQECRRYWKIYGKKRNSCLRT